MENFEMLERLKNLPQYKNYTDEQLIAVWLEKDKDKDKDLAIDELFIDKDERKDAKSTLRKYLRDYNIETISDKNTLMQLIYLEVLHKRFQREINKIAAEVQAIPAKHIDILHKNLKEIEALKTSLGLSRSQQTQGNDGFTVIQALKRRFKAWLENNQISRRFVCAHCGKFNWLKLKNSEWEVLKHPFIKDRYVTNDELIACYLQGKLSKGNIARVFGTSLDYIDWVVAKINPSTLEDLRRRNIS